jgi:hypothetical protein
MWEGEQARFGVQAKPASHGLAATEARLIITEDRHRPEQPPSVPYAQIVDVALLLGWLSVRYLERNTELRVPLLFETTGWDHLAALVRVFRAHTCPALDYPPRPYLAWDEVWRCVARHQVEMVSSLLLDYERVLSFETRREAWDFEKRGWRRAPVCRTRAGLTLLTDHGLLHPVDQEPLRPGLLSFGIETLCFPGHAIQSIQPAQRSADPQGLRFLLDALLLHRGPKPLTVIGAAKRST